MTQKRILTNQDIAFIIKKLKPIFATKDDLLRFATKIDLEDLKDDIDQRLTQHHSSLMNTMDKILKEVTTYRDEQTVSAYNSSDHENRLEALEKIHPHGHHAVS